MKRKRTIPRILRIIEINGFEVICMFNNGEKRKIDFTNLFNVWEVGEPDPEYGLKDPKAFKQLTLDNGTLSWKNISISLLNDKGHEQYYPYEPSPESLYMNSVLIEDDPYLPGKLIREMRLAMGMGQQELAEKSGTTKNYISRIEKNRSDIEWITLRKIVEAGFGKRLVINFE